MAYNFPNSPSNGDTVTVNSVTYTYNSTLGAWKTTAAAVGELNDLTDVSASAGTDGQVLTVQSDGTFAFEDASGGGGGGASVTTSDTAPSSPSAGDLWWNSSDGKMYVYYTDINSSQWVSVSVAGSGSGSGASTDVYATIDDLPLSGNTQGDMAHVTATNTLYFWNGSGWYKIALINTNPSISGVNSAYTLATDGTATTVTITATDPEGLPITYSIASDTSGSTATVAQGTGSNTNVFTITPSTDSANAGEFTLTFRASDGVNIATAPSTFSLSFTVSNSNYTTALITTNGSTGGNSSFTDSSSNSHTVTANGNTHQVGFSPYRSGGYSTYFDGSGDYLQVPDSSTLDLPADFTIEFWMYREGDTSGTYQSILGGNGSSSNGWNFYVTNSNNILSFFHSSFLINGPVIQDKRWYHVALTRSGTTLTMYVDGTSVGTATNSTSFDQSDANAGTRIGYDNGANGYFHGYLTDVRVVKGTAVYTAAFTPPTAQLTAITNTSLLACHLPYFADGSTNGHSITPNGNVATKSFAPYDYVEYAVGSHGGSGYFDGTGDYLSVAADTSFDFGSGDFTVEFWMYPTSIPSGEGGLVTLYEYGSNRRSWYIAFDGSKLELRLSSSGTSADTLINSASGVFAANRWYHVAMVREGNDITGYVDGESVATGTHSGAVYGNSTDPVIIGSVGTTLGGTEYSGSITDVRVVKGTAVYTAEFTPPTAPLSAVTNTSLLLDMQDAVILDKSQACEFIKVEGSSTASTTQTKYLDSSVQLTGTDPNVQIELPEALGSVFTMEGWFYVTNYSTYGGFFSGSNNNTNSNAKGISVAYDLINSDAQTTMINWNSTRPTNTWVHIAVTSDGTTLRAFVDGTLQTDTHTTVSDFTQTTTTYRIGARYNGGAAGLYTITGFFSDVRFTKGLARYTANFTPSTAALKG